MAQGLLDVSTRQGRREAVLLHGVTPAQLAGISEAQLEAIYGLAVDDMGAGRLAPALERMSFLVQHQPWERRYQVGLAHALQSVGQWAAAGRFYAQALLTDATDALCAYRSGECLEALGDTEAAREAFETAVALSWIGEGQPELREAALACLDVLARQGA